MVCTACTTKEARLPETAAPIPLPEVKEVIFTGNAQFSSRRLRREMVTQPRPFYTPWRRGEPYNPPTVEADLRRLKKFYFDRGFLDTTVTLRQVEQSPDGDSVRLEIAIDEGPPTIVTEVRLSGTIPPDLPPPSELLKLLPLQPRERINKADFDQSRELLLKRLQDASYARAKVIPYTEVDTESHIALVTFELEPGTRTVFGQTAIEGAQQVKEEAIRRQLTYQEGELYRQSEVAASADAIFGLGTFQAVTPRALNPDEDGAPMHLAFDVRERPPRSVQFGVGFSSVEGFRVQAEWLHRNIWHEANQLSFLGRFSSIEQKAEARFFMPYFLAPRTTFTQTAFARNEQDVGTAALGVVEEAQPAFDLFRVGTESRLGHQFSRTLRGFAGLELSLNDFRNVDPVAIAAAGEGAAEDNLLFIQFAELERRTTDNPLNPTRGMLLRGRVDHSNTAVISDVSFAKLVLEGRHYQRLWREVILASRLKVGGIQPYAGEETVPFNVRFFAGGPGSVRGFALNRLGPRDAEDNPIGGESLIEGSLELRFPIIGDVGGAVFVDFGNVFSTAFTYRLSDLRYAAGPGIRYNTPIGPVRVDVGFILNRRAGDDFGRVEFSIGHAF